jgi:hypothetical protein
MVKKLFIGALMVVMLVAPAMLLTGCGGRINENNLIGYWERTEWRSAMGMLVEPVQGWIIFRADKSFSTLPNAGGGIIQGTWEIDGSTLRLTRTGNTNAWQIYTDVGAGRNDLRLGSNSSQARELFERVPAFET